MSPPPSALSPPLSAPPIPLSMSTPAEDGPGTGSDPIIPAEEEDDDVFEAEPTPPAEVEANANKRRSQSLSALQSKEPQSPLKVSSSTSRLSSRLSCIMLNNVSVTYICVTFLHEFHLYFAD